MKSVILCAGEGTRATGYTGGGNKSLTIIPGYGRIVDYSLKTALSLTDELIVLVGYKSTEVREYVTRFADENFAETRISFAEQHQRDGLCDGILCCESLLGGDDFLLFLGDEIITEPVHKKMISVFHENTALAVCGFVNTPNRDDVRKTYSIVLSGHMITELVEKPTKPGNNLMGTGNCVFRNKFCDLIRGYQSKMAGRAFSFPDVLNDAIGGGAPVVASEIGKAYLNFNSEDDIKAFLSLSLI